MDKFEYNNKTTSNEDVNTNTETSTQKGKPKSRGKKRKRLASVSSSDIEDALPENTLEVEKNLHASAIKNNLDDVSVKKILKKVVTNDHVLALVKLREAEGDSSTEENSLRPKLTRAKAKELMKVSPKAAPWNLELTPIKHIPVKTRPEVTALIAQELPEDEDDEEYKPTHDDVPSDDDQALESCSDLESQPQTPATPKRQQSPSPKVVKDGPFKVPQELKTPAQRKLDLEEEATIALRTRSKLSLSATPIEHIESSFVPPDELPMPDVDVLWDEFLKDCLNPASASKNEDDDEADPEYNVAADPDAHCEDEEALENSIIKISKKELNDLVTELFNIVPDGNDDVMMENVPNTTSDYSRSTSFPAFKEEKTSNNMGQQQQHAKEGISENRDISSSAQNNTIESANELVAAQHAKLTKNDKNGATNEKKKKDCEGKSRNVNLQEAVPSLLRHLDDGKKNYIQVEDQVKILPEQILILQQQLRQHIQIATSNFLQLCVHPDHWKFATTYKNYLMSLDKMSQSKPNSVVNVCNLKPALELVDSWEKSVTEETPENVEMIKFINEMSEKCRRRCAQNSFFVGDFHIRLKSVIANSSVFLYPHLLPPTPYRADVVRRFIYHRSEDELIALALDEFWQYVECNPQLFKRPERPHPRHRWGLVATLQLVTKHMLTWYPTKALYAHVIHARNHGEKTNPIRRFFEKREVVPVKHRLLPFNPHITLYEQPEHEMPHLWVRHLATSSKRFKTFLFRHKKITGEEPKGVEIDLGKAVEAPKKNPLPIEFTQPIAHHRQNSLPQPPKPTTSDKFDVKISRTEPEPINQISLDATKNLYKVVQTSTGAYLMPFKISQPNTNVISTSTISNAKEGDNIIANNLPEDTREENLRTTLDRNEQNENLNTGTNNAKRNDETTEHCKCCVLLKKICKMKQTVITDFFKPKDREVDIENNCHCKGRKYPKISKRLRLFINYYKSGLQCAWLESKNKLQIAQNENGDNERNNNSGIEIEPIDTTYDIDDLAFVTSYQMKLLARASIARKPFLRQRLYHIFSKFDPDLNDVLWLTNELDGVFDVELVDMYKEFIGFLTPLQADEIDMFRDYFSQNCVTGLIKKVEEQVADKDRLRKILLQISAGVLDNLATACEICSGILSELDGYPKLAQYVFSLFPHKSKKRQDKECSESEGHKSQEAERRQSDDTLVNDTVNITTDYEADHSSSNDDDNHSENLSEDEDEIHEVKNKKFIKKEESTDETNRTEEHSKSLRLSVKVVSEDVQVKSEPNDWKRDEDKLILEVLKQSLTPEECTDKTTLEIIEDRQVLHVLSESLSHKTVQEIKERILYLLQFLVLSQT